MQAGSNDKRFVIEEVTRALQTMADCMDPAKLLPRILPYAAHKNPKVSIPLNSMRGCYRAVARGRELKTTLVNIALY